MAKKKRPQSDGSWFSSTGTFRCGICHATIPRRAAIALGIAVRAGNPYHVTCMDGADRFVVEEAERQGVNAENYLIEQGVMKRWVDDKDPR